MRYLYIARAQGNPAACEVGESTDPLAIARLLYGEELEGTLATRCAEGLTRNLKGIETSGEFSAFPESAVPEKGTAEFARFVSDLWITLSTGNDTLGPYRRGLMRLLEVK